MLIREAKQESKTKSLVMQNTMQAEISNLDSDSNPAKPDKPKRSHIEKVFNKTIDRAVRPWLIFIESMVSPLRQL